MLGVVSGYYDAGSGDASTGWDFADVMPGGSANWGGSFLGVPTSRSTRRPPQLALWLAARAAGRRSRRPVRSRALEAQERSVADSTNAFFNDAPVGEIFAPFAGRRRPGEGFRGLGHPGQRLRPVLDQISQGETDGDAAWAAAMDLLNQLVVRSSYVSQAQPTLHHPRDPARPGLPHPHERRRDHSHAARRLRTDRSRRPTTATVLPAACALTFRQRLSRFDVKASPVPLHLAVLHPLRPDRPLPDRLHAQRLAVPVASAQGPGRLRRPRELRRRARTTASSGTRSATRSASSCCRRCRS